MTHTSSQIPFSSVQCHCDTSCSQWPDMHSVAWLLGTDVAMHASSSWPDMHAVYLLWPMLRATRRLSSFLQGACMQLIARASTYKAMLQTLHAYCTPLHWRFKCRHHCFVALQCVASHLLPPLATAIRLSHAVKDRCNVALSQSWAARFVGIRVFGLAWHVCTSYKWQQFAAAATIHIYKWMSKSVTSARQ